MNTFRFIDLKKAAKKSEATYTENASRIAILGDCATQHLSTAISGLSAILNIPTRVLDLDYNQIAVQLIDLDSTLYSFKPDIVLLWMCTEKLYDEFFTTPTEQRSSFAKTKLEELSQYWQLIESRSSAEVFQFDFPIYNDAVFGGYSGKVDVSFLYQLRKLNYLLHEEAYRRNRIQLLGLDGLQSQIGRDLFHSDSLYFTSKMPVKVDYVPDIAKLIVDAVQIRQGLFKKCIVLDLDNTLWGGVIGDDGLEGIEIGELGIGPAFLAFQKWLKELKKRGILLAVCSKNEEAAAKAPFLEHPDMILKLDDFSIFIANWNDKASNIKIIQETLNIGMDSFVFIDDNPFERQLVRGSLPQVEVPELPEDPALYLSYLQHLNLFETCSYSAEDELRTSKYRIEIERQSLQKQFVSFNDYLQSLEMFASYAPFDKFHYARIAQLTQRSNQFNLRTIRYNESEIEQLAKDPAVISLYFNLEDKLANHGLISVVIMKPVDEQTLFIDTWLMSCRVLKRGMEEFIINQIIQTAQNHGYLKVVGEYLKTPKNAMVANIYEKMGFTALGDGVYEAITKNYKKHETQIKEK